MKRILPVLFWTVATLNASEGATSLSVAPDSSSNFPVAQDGWSITFDQLQDLLKSAKVRKIPSLKELTVQKIVDEVGICGFNEFLKKLEGVEKESEVKRDSLKAEGFVFGIDPVLKEFAAKRWYENVYDWALQQDIPIDTILQNGYYLLSMLPNGNIVIAFVGYNNNIIQIRDSNTFNVVKSFPVKEGFIKNLVALQNGDIAINNSFVLLGSELTVLDPISGVQKWNIKYPEYGNLLMSVLPDGNLVISVNDNIEIRDSNTGSLIKSFSEKFVADLAFLKNGDIAISSWVNAEVKVLDPKSGVNKWEMFFSQVEKKMSALPNGNLAIGLRDYKDQHIIATIEIRDSSTGSLVKNFSVPKEISFLYALPNGYIVSGSYDGTAVILDPETGRQKSFTVSDATIENMVILPNGDIASLALMQGCTADSPELEVKVQVWKVSDSIRNLLGNDKLTLAKMCEISKSIGLEAEAVYD